MHSRGVISVLLPTLVLASLAACVDDPTGPEGGVAGNWSVSYTDDATGCGEGITSGTVTFVVVQTGDVLAVTSDGIVFTGTLNGTQSSWSGSYPEDGGTTTEEFTVTFTNSNTMFNGGSTWTWTAGLGGCSGSSTITGSK